MTMPNVYYKCSKCGAYLLISSISSPETDIADHKDPDLVAAILADRIQVGGPDCESCYQKDFKAYFQKRTGDVSA